MTITDVPRPPLADGIRRAVKATGLSVREVARRAGVSPATLSNWINGISTPDPALLNRFAVRMGVDVEDLHAGLPDLYAGDAA